MTAYDVIVVGAGSAGCALAARLSEDDSRQVLLLEAGTDYRTAGDYPREIARASSMAATVPGHPANWNFVGELTPGRSFPVARGKILGGSSAINGTYFVRARPQDFDEFGSDLWSYDRLLPYFRRSERDLDFDGPYHGQAGPIPVARVRTLHPVSTAFVEACLEAGFPEEPDKNAPGTEGIGPVPRNVLGGVRVNAAIAYLAPVRDRPNLTIVGDTLVIRVLFDGGRAVGVAAVRGGRPVTFRAGEIILSAGAIKTPHLLLLSGIGPAAQLRRHGIDVVHDSPGVGQGLRDHPTLAVNFTVAGRRMPVPDDVQPFETCLNDGDVQLLCGVVSYSRLIRTRSLPSYLTRPAATLGALRRLPLRLVLSQARHSGDLSLLVGLEAEESAGEVCLASADPAAAPAITFNYLSDPADLPRVLDGLRLALDLLRSRSFRSLQATVTSPSSDENVGDWAVASMGSAFHSTGTARLGTDPAAVVDPHCRVHGVEGLRVADLSIAPRIRRGPAATAVVIGERVAGLIDQKPIDQKEAPT